MKPVAKALNSVAETAGKNAEKVATVWQIITHQTT